MKRTLHFTLLILLATGLFAQQITNVRLSPQKSSYKTLEFVTIYWDYTGLSIPSDAPVKITLWREGNSQNICKIAENVRITRGSTGYQWTIPATCINPHTGTREDLTQGNLWVRVRWQRHRPAVYGESSHFTIKKSSSDFTSVLATGSNYSATFLRASLLILKGITPVDRNKGLYVVKWDYKYLPANTKIKAELTKGNSIYCTIRANVPVSARQLMLRSGEICNDGKPQPKPGDRYKIRISVMDSPSIFAESNKWMIPGVPDLITCILFTDMMYLAITTAKVCVEVEQVNDYVPLPLGPFTVKFHVEDKGTKTYTFYFHHRRHASKCRDIKFYKPIDPNGEIRDIWAEVDTTNVIRETNENNNKAESFIRLVTWDFGIRKSRGHYKICSNGKWYVKKKGSSTWEPTRGR